MWHVSLNMSYQMMKPIHLEIESSYKINICCKTGILELLGIILLSVNHARSVSNEIQTASFGLKWTIYSSVFRQFRLLMMKLSFSWLRLIPLFCPTIFIWKLKFGTTTWRSLILTHLIKKFGGYRHGRNISFFANCLDYINFNSA